ncbi:MAG: cysteine-rich CWC family protein [Bacteroidales bacterium]|nr:cysteine-rich CWC family protein [Bacteroidales bacterium]
MKAKLQLNQPDQCPRCGKNFHCSKSGKCWCYEVETNVSLLDEIQQKYATCLCPDCLNELNQKSKRKDLDNIQ